METSAVHKLALITFPPSLDSELARFLVEHYGIEHEEQPHAFIFCFFATLWHGRTLIFPVLYNESLKLAGPQAIADYFDRGCVPELRLLPETPGEKRQVTSDWTMFNQTLAFATAVFAYYHLLPHRQLMLVPLSRGAPAFDALDRADLVTRREENFVTHAKRAGLDAAREDAPLVEPIDVLDRKA